MARELIGSGVEWIGTFPKEWELDLAGQHLYQVKNKNESMRETNLLSLSYGRIKRRDINANDGLLPGSFEGYNIIEADDIVLRFTDLQNDQRSLKVGRATERGIITSAYTTVRPVDANESRFLYYALHSYDVRKGFYGMGSGVRQGLKWQEAKYIKLPLPPVEEQGRIADYLDDKCAQIDKATSAAESSIEEYKAYQTSVIDRTVKRSTAEHVKLNRLIALQSGDALTKEKMEYGGGIPVYGGGGIKGFTNKANYPAGTLIISRQGATCGTTRLIDVDFWATEHAMVATIKTPIVTPQWLLYALTSLNLGRLSMAAAQPGISQEKVFSQKIPLPSLEEQNRITSWLSSKCEQIASAIESKQAIIEELKAYKQSLIYEVVTGKKEV